MTLNAVGGVSWKCSVHVGGKKTRTLRTGVLRQCQDDARELCASLLKKLPLTEHERLLTSETQQRGPNSSPPTLSDDFSFYSMDIDSMIPPPGEEGFSVSHAGDEVTIYQELEELTTSTANRQRLDTRDRSGRIALLASDWASQYEVLTDALLNYMHNPLEPLEPPSSVNETNQFTIEVVDIFGSSPIRLTVAITIRTLDVYRQSHRVTPRFSIHAEAKMLCFLHGVYYRRHLAEQLRISYDVYLQLHRRIDHRLDKVLGHDSDNWRMLNSCPAFQYKLTDEPPLEFSILCACDGNNSAKLVDPAIRGGQERLDTRIGTSSIWLNESYVDAFKDEVRSARARQARDQCPARDPDDPWVDEPDSVDSAELRTVCVDRWRNAAPESQKKMFAIFKKSGIFITVCRHGFLLTICDMVRSGELMKYPIASVKKLMDVFGSNILYGYDIKCAFEKILLRSTLGDSAKRLNVQGVVPTFHGHAHNCLCQLQHHSKHKLGAGLEDFETCERVFSESNALASEIRNATEFHRHQALDEHFHFADTDRYAALSDFIFNNYVQALTSISTTTTFLANFHASNPTLDTDFDGDLEDEHLFLQRLATKQDESSVEIDYVKALNEYEEAQLAYEQARIQFGQLDLRPNYSPKDAGNVRRRHTHAATKRDQKVDVVVDYERQMALDTRWGPDHPEHVKAQSRITNHLYHKAVDDVERLVVMRLLELTKLQMSGLGYKLRTQISTALKSRATAIRNALTRYNKYASQLNPPRPPLQWEQIVDYSFLAEFDLLRKTGTEIQTKRWANPSYRHASTQHLAHQRAKEEIRRLNVEVGRLCTKIRDDALDYPRAIAQLELDNPPLAAHLQRRWQWLRSANGQHLWRIDQILRLPGYSGPMSPGTHEGRQCEVTSALEGAQHGLADEADEGEGDEDALSRQLQDVHTYMEGLDHHRVDLELAE
ncbi:hypothetical protein EDB19DRAFT_1835287 [Suillus lakei]|nr:hypothetical protein EDB19DRAFT_1835287 [Suillus lakei]